MGLEAKMNETFNERYINNICGHDNGFLNKNYYKQW